MYLSCTSSSYCVFVFFFNDTATTEIYTLSLHDALPIWGYVDWSFVGSCGDRVSRGVRQQHGIWWESSTSPSSASRSEEHTSELQSQSNLVCRLLLEKKKKEEELR